METMMLEVVFFFFILQLCIRAMMTQRYRQHSRCWWRVLSVFTNPGLWIHIAEHALSLPPQSLSFVSLLHLNLITNFVAVISLGLLGITGLFFCFSISICPLRSCSVPFFYLSPSGPPHIEASTLRIVLSHTVLSLSHNLHLNKTQLQKLL